MAAISETPRSCLAIIRSKSFSLSDLFDFVKTSSQPHHMILRERGREREIVSVSDMVKSLASLSNQSIRDLSLTL